MSDPRAGQGAIARTFRRARRRASGLLGRPTVELVYTRRYQLELPGVLYDPRRGEQILAFLDSAGLLGRRSLHPPAPATFRQLRRVHTRRLPGLARPAGSLTRIVGLTLTEDQADRVLAMQRFMVGGTIRAAALALESKGIAATSAAGSISPSPTGGRVPRLQRRGGRHRRAARPGLRARASWWWTSTSTTATARAPLFARDPTVHTFSIHNATSGDFEAVEATASSWGSASPTALPRSRAHPPPPRFRGVPAGAGLLSRGSRSGGGRPDRRLEDLGRGPPGARPLRAGLRPRRRAPAAAGRHPGRRLRPERLALQRPLRLLAAQPRAGGGAAVDRGGPPLPLPPSGPGAGAPRADGRPGAARRLGLTADDLAASLGGPHPPAPPPRLLLPPGAGAGPGARRPPRPAAGPGLRAAGPGDGPRQPHGDTVRLYATSPGASC